jgi:hypothetical protein
MLSHLAPIHPVVIFGPFTKWGVDFMDYNLALARGNHHIIVAMDYFTKWDKAMLIIKYDGETATLFVFNQIIAWFRIPKEIIIDHNSHF